MSTATPKPTIFLHVGHGKTGSSYLQTCFATSIEVLEANGIAYPIDATPLKRAQAGLTTEGNFPPISLQLGHSIDVFKALLANAPHDSAQGILISNEGLFQSILLHDFLKKMVQAAPDYEIRILLFIRDPLDHLISAYQELLKADVVNDIESLFEHSSVPSNVNELLDKSAELSVTVTTVNFSRHKKELKKIVEQWLELAPGTLNVGPKASVNRSMDKSEILVQRVFNKYVGNFARSFVADALARELPDHKPSKPFIAYPVLERFIQRMERDTPRVNARILKSEHYQVPSFNEAKAQLPSEDEATKIELSMEQLDVLARNISKFFPAERQKKSENKTG